MLVNYTKTVLDYALIYAAMGLRVFPVHTVIDKQCACGVDDCKSPGKHPMVSAWQNTASSIPNLIRMWWGKQWPNANLAIATGKISQCFVIDLDGPEGQEAFQSMLQ